MGRLIHISDLHFGRTRPELLRPLIARLNELEADLIAISGDLTQRARSSQFRAARAFLDRLETPTLVVPGNHDVPLEHLIERVLFPYRRYRKWIGRELEPCFETDDMAVVGLNTVNPLAWQRGRVPRHAANRVRRAFHGESRRVCIVVAHHPLEHRPTDTKALMTGAGEAIDAFAEYGADIVLTGHLHSWRAEPFAERVGRRGALQVHAGTGLSTRLRGEENDFNVLTVTPDEVTVERHAAAHGEERFSPVQRAVFRSGPQGWRPVPGIGRGGLIRLAGRAADAEGTSLAAGPRLPVPAIGTVERVRPRDHHSPHEIGIAQVAPVRHAGPTTRTLAGRRTICIAGPADGPGRRSPPAAPPTSCRGSAARAVPACREAASAAPRDRRRARHRARDRCAAPARPRPARRLPDRRERRPACRPPAGRQHCGPEPCPSAPWPNGANMRRDRSNSSMFERVSCSRFASAALPPNERRSSSWFLLKAPIAASR